jgi:hypothetical protein
MDQKLPIILKNLDENQDVKKVDSMKETLNKFLGYFEKTYIGRQERTCWLKGKFPIQIRNKHDNVLVGRQLFTNRQEGFHSRLKKSIVASASLWALLGPVL